MRPFIPKDDQRLPDSYGVKIQYLDGTTEQFDIASHVFTKDTGIFEFWTHEQSRVNWIQMASVKRIEFDDKFTKIIEIKADKPKGAINATFQ